jgi:hypothetical protein
MRQRKLNIFIIKANLATLCEANLWEFLIPLSEQSYSDQSRSHFGPNRTDLTILFKMLVLQQLFNLSEGAPFHLRVRRWKV